MRLTELGKTGEKIPVIGQGTWGIKARKPKDNYDQWKKSLRRGIELGMTHIDTAEAYGWGISERIVGEVVAEYSRDELFITSKLLPTHFRYSQMKKAAEKSLKRLGLKYFDLYLIHYPNPFIPIKRSVRLLEDLLVEGETRYIGVSNFSVEKFQNAQECLKKAELVNTQLRTNVVHQKHIINNLSFYRKHGVTLTAYSPLGHKGLKNINEELMHKLEKIAEKHNATIHQIAIAWLVNIDGVITIPKAFQLNHVESNALAGEIVLSDNEINLVAESRIK
ncbi:MAG: aldo/keto reductase [Candidatus Thermoplasmatota archaeon]|nr:aldo/keto reductase [Candidatus Thermoplasmatota archaeon]